MAVDVLELIRGATKARASSIEQLALRLFKGQTVPAADVLRVLSETGGTAEQLQAEIERLERVDRLRADVAKAAALPAELAEIDRKFDAATAQLTKAQQAIDELKSKYGMRHMELRHQIDTAERAADRLLEPANLGPADRIALADAQAEFARAAEMHSDTRKQLADARQRVASMQEQLDAAKASAAERPSVEQYREDVAQSERALEHRTAAAKDAERAEQAAAKAMRAAEQTVERMMARLRKGATR